MDEKGQKSRQGIFVCVHLRLVLCESWQEGDCLRGEDAHQDADEEDCLVAQLHITVLIVICCEVATKIDPP